MYGLPTPWWPANNLFSLPALKMPAITLRVWLSVYHYHAVCVNHVLQYPVLCTLHCCNMLTMHSQHTYRAGMPQNLKCMHVSSEMLNHNYCLLKDSSMLGAQANLLQATYWACLPASVRR
jgi:hypothetical protein